MNETSSLMPGYADPSKQYDLTYLCLGAGVQSTALLLLSNLELHNVPRADFAIFADTGAEPPVVYATLDALLKVSKIPIVIVRAGNLEKDFVRASRDANSRCASIPGFTKNKSTMKKGILFRQCTAEYKVKPIERYIKRVIFGLRPRQRVKASVRAMMGISWDEYQRMKPSRNSWTDLDYPLVDNRLRRHDCFNLISEHGPSWPTPQRSACYFCSFHSDAVWGEMKNNTPELFERACNFDEEIRNNSRLDSQVFLHRSATPLRAVDFSNKGQLEFNFMAGFTGCETGHCGI